MLESLRGYYVFAHVAEALSFSRAAERLDITKSAVSKHVAALERELGVQLIVRTTRKLALTDAGERVYASCARLPHDLELARDAAQSEHSRMVGRLRITAPAALGAHYLMPALVDFMNAHPRLTVDLVLDDAFIDLVQARVDVALRVGGRNDRTLVSRRIAPVELLLVASPAYLRREGVPRTPQALARHQWLLHSPSAGAGAVALHNGKRVVRVQAQGRLSCNSGPASLSAARAGWGIVGTPDFEVAQDIHEGALVRVLPKWKLQQTSLHLVFPPRQHVLGRVRAFADFIAERFREPPWRCDART